MTKDWDTLPGQIRLEPRDIIQLNGAPAVVVYTNDSGARVRPLIGKAVTITTLGGKTRTFVKPGDTLVIAVHTDRALVIGKANDAQWAEASKAFNKTISAKAEPQPSGNKPTAATTETTNTESDKHMAKAKTTKRSKRTPKAKTKPEAAPEANGSAELAGNSRGRLGTLFGNSVVRCVIAAGKAGATFEAVMAGLKEAGITAKESTVKQNLRLGANGKLVGADLTKEQLATLGA